MNKGNLYYHDAIHAALEALGHGLPRNKRGYITRKPPASMHYTLGALLRASAMHEEQLMAGGEMLALVRCMLDDLACEEVDASGVTNIYYGDNKPNGTSPDDALAEALGILEVNGVEDEGFDRRYALIVTALSKYLGAVETDAERTKRLSKTPGRAGYIARFTHMVNKRIAAPGQRVYPSYAMDFEVAERDTIFRKGFVAWRTFIWAPALGQSDCSDIELCIVSTPGVQCDVGRAKAMRLAAAKWGMDFRELDQGFWMWFVTDMTKAGKLLIGLVPEMPLNLVNAWQEGATSMPICTDDEARREVAKFSDAVRSAQQVQEIA